MQRGLGQRGAVLPFVAISLSVLLGFTGLSVDVGYWQYQERQQQNAVDSAAIGGAQALDAAGCPAKASAQSAADTDAAMYGYSGGQVTVNNPPAAGAYSGNNCAVSVSITGTKPSFFAQIFGKGSMTETTSATAELVSTNNNCIYLLSTTSTSTFSGGNVSASGCGISMNGSGSFCNKGSVNAARIGYAGSAPNVCGGTTFTGATPAPQMTAPNPCPEITGCNYLANNPPSTANCQTLTANMNPTIAPGCYNNLTVGGCGTVSLQPGVYVLNGTSNFAGSSFVGSGVTFYVTANGTAPDFSAATSATISPPTTGNEANVLYYQVPTNSTAPNLSGSSVHWKGLVYAPGATGVNFNGALGDYTVLVLGSANLTSTSGYNFGTPPPGTTLPQNVVLTQ
ncbi:MAG TPA: Tad domain-containing protein [Candidatus Cybelea sp.]|nr:Tad domain-containing protein [Candidatus Cybelea sp.]